MAHFGAERQQTGTRAAYAPPFAELTAFRSNEILIDSNEKDDLGEDLGDYEG